jgi:glycosyltransferase involved in cell wall biosynthesis
MKLALAHEMLVKLGGAERVLGILGELYPKAPIYTLFADQKLAAQGFPDHKIHTSRLQAAYALTRKQRFLLPWMAKAIEKFDFRHFDVVVSSSSGFAHGIKVGPNTTHVCYCHSPMRYAWDYTHEYAKHFSPFVRFWAERTLHKVRQWDYETSKRPDVVLANSNHVQQRIKKYWRRDTEVVYPPVDVKRFTATAHHEDYFLIVSALTPFKRLDLAIHAFNKIGRKLLIIGDGAQKEELRALARPNIEFLGRKDDHALRDYLENCRALIFPGEEDFGIVPVEAMAAGKPVLAYGKGGVLETIRPGVSGEFFFELSPKSLEDGLTKLMTNEKHYNAQHIHTLAEPFDKEVFKVKMAAIIEKAMK